MFQKHLMAYNRLPSLTCLCGDERWRNTAKEAPCGSSFQFPADLWDQMRDRAQTEVSFLPGEKRVVISAHFPGYYTFLGHYFTSFSSKIVIYLNSILVAWEPGQVLESEYRFYGLDGMSESGNIFF